MSSSDAPRVRGWTSVRLIAVAGAVVLLAGWTGYAAGGAREQSAPRASEADPPPLPPASVAAAQKAAAKTTGDRKSVV